MKDEIKEILECLEKYGQLTPDAIDDLHYIRDYIINLQTIEKQYSALLSENVELQEELKSANESITWWQNRFNALQEENERLKVECSQLENIDYLEEINRERTLRVLNDKIKDKYKSKNEKAIEYIKENGIIDLNGYDLLNILQGSDNYEKNI